MIQWLQQPKCPVVSTFVECYWLIERLDDSGSFQFPKLNPDPSGHLIISPKNQEYSYESGGDLARGVGCHLLFPHLQTLHLDHTKPFVHLGVKFKVGALYSIKSFTPKHPILDRVTSVDMHSLLGNGELDILNLLFIARQDGAMCRDQLDGLLMLWLSQFQKDKYSKLVSRALEVIDETAIAKLGDKLHCTQRTLERAFNRVTGFTLKQCQSMNRLEAMLEHLYSLHKDEIDWVEIAFKFGFSDQPHLIRYLKAHLGLTPNTYANKRNLTIDLYGGVSTHVTKV
ncbi:helix-turn-helix domain-containing protein [Litorilituus lipolyticus]|uniref:AraC family transcriptional regulator n=1 Tax=Litorilituus lipolyticus TaxID=2491017 RepID=A0A502KQF2_9GAMM|nr:helix-turn-helix domain-containing protein [Litorilituus lipolyticus]TPH13970.1 AraC family transcriptional regulator [Litorilituus lipolyticus]